MRRQPGDRYKRMREMVLPWLASVLEKPVELVMQEPGGVTSTLFSPPLKREQTRLEEVVQERHEEERVEKPERKMPVELEDEWDY